MPLNWAPPGVPDASDSAIISAGGIVALSKDASVAGLTLDGGTISGVGTLTITGAANWMAGTLSGHLTVAAGTLTLNGTNTIASGGRFELAGGDLAGTNRITGSGLFVWSGGRLTGDVTVGSGTTMNVIGANVKYLYGGNLINEGHVIWTDGGTILGASNGTITNRGIFEMRNDVPLGFCCAGPVATFVNAPEGTIRKTQAVGESLIDSFLLINRGAIDIQSGTLRLTAIQHRLEDGGRFSGAGLTLISTGARLEGTSTLETGARLELNTGFLEGTATLKGPGTFVWTGGNLRNELTISQGTQMRISGTAEKYLQGNVLNNFGSIVWTDAGGISGTLGGRINNAGTFEARNDAPAQFCCAGPTPTFHNLPGGTFRKLASNSRTIFFNFAFDNDGLVEVLTGILTFSGGGTSSGTFTNASNATIVFSTGNMVLGTGSKFVISGFNQVDSGAILTLNGTHTIAAGGRFELAGGDLAGTNRITGPGLFVWSSGRLTGEVTVDSGTTMNVVGASVKYLYGGNLINEGHVIWTDNGTIYGASNGALTNKGVFEMRNDAVLGFCCAGPVATFVNTAQGTIRKTQAVGESQIDSFLLINRGAIDIQSGTLTLAGIEHRLENGGRFSGLGRTLITKGARLEGTSTLEAGARLELSTSYLEGTATLKGPGTFVWTGGNLRNELTISQGTQMLVSGNAQKYLDGIVLNNFGSIVWTGQSDIFGLAGATINNYGRFEARNDQSLAFCCKGPLPTFNNFPDGTFQKAGSSGQTDVSTFIFNNSGALWIDSGTFRLPDIILANLTHVPNIILATTPLPDFDLGSFNFTTIPTAPIRSTNEWHFHADYTAFVSGLRVQSTLTPNMASSWTNLPGGGQMDAASGSGWNLKTTNVPVGDRYFRAVASATGFRDATSTIGPITVLALPLPDFQTFGSTATTVPIRSNNHWQFNAGYRDFVTGLEIRVQSTLTPLKEGSWTDLPGGGQMARTNAIWTLDTTEVPTGDRFFRAIASAPGYLDRTSIVPDATIVLEGIGRFGYFSYETTAPPRTGTSWEFTMNQPSLANGLHLKVQSSSSPEVESSWTDLPGGGQMGHQESNWSMTTTNLPLGLQSFRVVAYAPTYTDRISAALGPLNIGPPLPTVIKEVSTSGTYSLLSVAGTTDPVAVYIQAIEAAKYYLTIGDAEHYKEATEIALIIYATRNSSAQLTVDSGQTFNSAGLMIGQGALFILKGIREGDVFAGIVATDGATLLSEAGSGLIGHDAGSLQIIKDQGALVSSTAPIISEKGTGLIGQDGNSLIGHDTGSFVPGGGGSLAGQNEPTASMPRIALSSLKTASIPAFTGLMTIIGNFHLGAGAGLAIAIAGTNTAATGAQEYDQLVVSGRAELGGVVGFGLFNPADVTNRTNVFSPPLGATFDVVVASNIVTTSLIVRGPIWGSGLHFNWSVVNRPDGKQALRLVAVAIAPPLFFQTVGAKLRIEYPTNFIGYVLQSSRDLSSTNWMDKAVNTPAFEIATTNSMEFFRVIKK